MKHQKGFALLELLLVLAILSVLAYAGSMKFLTVSQNTQDQNTLKNEMKQLADALLQARQLASKSGSPSFICGGLTCDGDWSSGFILYQEDLSNDQGSDGDTMYRQVTFDGFLDLSWQGFPATKQQIEFQSNGLSGYQNGTFQFCLGVWQAGLVLNQSGRFYVTDLQENTEGDCS